MSHYDLLPAEGTNEFMVSMLEMRKSYKQKFALGELFTCGKPSFHDPERNGDLCVESSLYQFAKLTLHTKKNFNLLAA